MQHLVDGVWRKCTAKPGNCPYMKEGAPHLKAQEECNRFNDNVILKYNRIKNKLDYTINPEIQDGLVHVIVSMEDEDDEIDAAELLTELSKYNATDIENMTNDEIRDAYWLAFQSDIYQDSSEVIMYRGQRDNRRNPSFLGPKDEDDLTEYYADYFNEVAAKWIEEGRKAGKPEDKLGFWTKEEEMGQVARYMAETKSLPYLFSLNKNDFFRDRDVKEFDFQAQRQRLEKLFNDVTYSKRELQEYKEAFSLIEKDYEQKRKEYDDRMRIVEEEEREYLEWERQDDLKAQQEIMELNKE